MPKFPRAKRVRQELLRNLREKRKNTKSNQNVQISESSDENSEPPRAEPVVESVATDQPGRSILLEILQQNQQSSKHPLQPHVDNILLGNEEGTITRQHDQKKSQENSGTRQNLKIQINEVKINIAAERTSTMESHNSDSEHELFTTTEKEEGVQEKHVGRRIINVSHFCRQLLALCNHGPVFVENLSKTEEERKRIEKNTILQSESGEWMELRRSLLTASNFGKIIKRRSDTSCANAVKELLYKPNLNHVASITHGREHEKKALVQLSAQIRKEIEPCGLFIECEHPFLGATPDGLCGNDAVIEVKCPITAHKIGIKEAIAQKKVTFWKINKEGEEEVNKTHNWYYQVQGQLHITKRQKCIFAVWANENEPLKVEIIERDDDFWKKKMEEKLIKFYMDCILPELVDPRHPRNLPIRDPEYIQEQIDKKKEKKTKGSINNSE